VKLPVAETYTAADGVPISYEFHGTEAPALVFVHGWSCDRRYWRGQIEPFSGEYKVVAIDLAGHGNSGRGREDWTIQSFGADVAAVFEALDLERVILVGHSMGGDVVIVAARRLPGRVVGLVWVDTYKQLGNPSTAEQVQSFVETFRADFEETTRSMVRGMFSAAAEDSLVEWVVDDMASAPRPVALGALASSFAYGRTVTEPLQELHIPVVAINPADPPTDVASLERYGVNVVLMPEVGHFMMMEDPEGFNQLLSEVVEEFMQGS
jgi:pimeloyl-ACP methyl ester carboxylesterase